QRSNCGLRKSVSRRWAFFTSVIEARSESMRMEYRERGRLVLHLQRVLIHPHRDLFSSQSILSEKLPVLEPDIAMAINLAGKLGRVQRPRKHVFGNGAAQHSTQHRLWAVSPVLPLPMSKMVLHVVVMPPSLMDL